MRRSGNGQRTAICISDRSSDICAADIAATVIVVLCGVLPDRLADAKLQRHPLGSPVQANDWAAARPPVGVIVSIRVPGLLALALTELAESDKV